MVLGADAFKGVFSILPSCATSNADKADAKNTVDKESLRTLVANLVDDGVHGIITTGSMGEVHAVNWEEHKEIIDTVIDVVNDRVPVLVGTWAPNTRESIMKTKYAADAGADGVMNGPPQYVEPTVDNTIQYYKDLNDYCPDMAIMIYSNPGVFRVTIPVARYEQIMEEVPNVVAVKETISSLRRMLVEAWMCKDKISFMSHSSLLYPCMTFGFTGAWDPTWVNCGPGPVLKLYDACEKKDWETAKAIAEDFRRLDLVFEKVLTHSFGQYQVNWEHLLLNAAGYVQTGPSRRPFVHVPDGVKKAAEVMAEEYKKMVAKWK
jgi:hydratase-aldolase